MPEATEASRTSITVIPANEASWNDLQAVFGTRGYAAHCQCQYFKVFDKDWKSLSVTELAGRLRQQTACGNPDAPATTGLVAYLEGEPVGWCAVEPRVAYPRLKKMRVPWSDRDEDREDPTVWAVTCFAVRVGYRRRGVMRALARAAVDFARERGAGAIEGYPMMTEPGKDLTWGELYVGSRTVFAEAGFTEVSHPTKLRYVMRIDFER